MDPRSMSKKMSKSDTQNLLAQLPKVSEILKQSALKAWTSSSLATPAVREVLQQKRESLRNGGGKVPTARLVAMQTRDLLEERTAPRLRRVLNGTGVLIHTNLGRSPLGSAQRDAIEEAVGGYATLEYDLEAGQRGSRHHLVTHLLTSLTGAEDALVVNNNAAALVLAISALAGKKEVLVSRGQLVEIGGSFRIPDICKASGAKLVEVGTTNRTRLKDFKTAIGKRSGMLLRVHPSNYRIEGFTESVDLQQLVSLGRETGLPVIDDLGSGALLDLSRSTTLQREPLVSESVSTGADIVTFSGDKLLGGPQAGIAAGSKAAIEAMRRHPLMRAFRPGKLTFSVLDATLRAYLKPESLGKELPLWTMLQMTLEDLQRWGGPLLRALVQPAKRAGLNLTLGESNATTGGGSLPEESMPSLALTFEGPGGTLSTLQRELRAVSPPVIGYLQEGVFRLDLRTLAIADRVELREAVLEALARIEP
jgi:L-seryl-tRNA(Ser) seleniumtransferase